MAASVELGFVEPISEVSPFVSKVGGKPLWLNIRKLPLSERLTCKKCGNPMILLLQIYAPKEDERCFHRTLFVFMCKTEDCCEKNRNENFTVLRCQLPKINEFYDCDSDKVTATAADFHKLCHVCGCLGSKTCSQCNITNYCSKHHQVIDWKVLHKFTCNKGSGGDPKETHIYCLPEMEIVIEPENLKKNIERSQKERSKDYVEYLKNSETEKDNFGLQDQKALEKMSARNADEQYQKFKNRISHEPQQVLRYEKGGHPLWVSNENKLKPANVPDCQCGAPRNFEFQVLPQLLNYLSLDAKYLSEELVQKSIDWGTLAIYTCSRNCDMDDEAYLQEFLWKQDFSKKSLETQDA